MNNTPEVLLGANPGMNLDIYRFEGLICQITAYDLADVVPALQQIESFVREGAYAAGFISYEAAQAFDIALTTQELHGFPLLWFGVFRERRLVSMDDCTESSDSRTYMISTWQSDVCREEYLSNVDKIRDYIAAGDVYQVNYTFRETCSFSGDARQYFRELYRAQTTPFSAFIDLDRFSILSASPELFFKLDEGVLTVRPMKGTAKRGASIDDDKEIVAGLLGNEKERAENLMIVDLLRNDLGRVSENGSVTVNSLFDVETLGTVHQMTSTVSSRLRVEVGLVDLFRALFPCGSITGAPKRRAMEIIAEMESSPRRLYTGCIGYFAPGMQQAVFSVAIRTVLIDKQSGRGELGVGSGITWYSEPDAEFEECLAKGLFAQEMAPEFNLIESFLYEEGNGFFLFDRHLDRLDQSASYFGFSFDSNSVRRAVEDFGRTIDGNSKVRLLLSRDGSLALEQTPIVAANGACDARIGLAGTPVDSTNPFLYHKTSNRALYLCELEKRPDCLDVIFVNERGEVTEGVNHNIVARLDGLLLTPPVCCGLLPGTFRAELLASGEIEERVIMLSDLTRAEEVYLVNSVRRWRRVRLV